MATAKQGDVAVLRVIDALDHPHGGRILRLKVEDGSAPPLKKLRGSRLEARSPEGDQRRTLRVEGFPVFWGKASDERVRRTGRLDLHVFDEDGEGTDPVATRWTLTSPEG